MNLISKATEREADEVHLADCVFAAQLVLNRASEGDIYDIGSGNGLPGIVLAILSPHRQIFCVESDIRKAEFLKQTGFRLGLKNVHVLNTRFEALSSGNISVAISRGFATITKALLLGSKSFAPQSRYFHMKANTWSTEIAEMPSQLCAVWSPELVGEYNLPESQARRAVVMVENK